MKESTSRTMLRALILLVTCGIATGALIGVDARTTEAVPPVLTRTEDGKPILLGRMVVTARALPQED